eukprot:scaffold217113_cov36-Tisochrysis_lutea.AAC.1
MLRKRHGCCAPRRLSSTDILAQLIPLYAHLQLLQNSPFYVLVSFRKPAEWWSYGLVKAQPIAKVQGFRTTGNESMTAFVYINLEKVPGRSTS